MKRNILIILLAFIVIRCAAPEKKLADGVRLPDPQSFSSVIDAKKVGLFTLKNDSGMRVDITNHGGRIVSLLVPDKNGVFDDVVTGYHSLKEYLVTSQPYFGSLIGRYGNRIANGKFSIGNKEYQLPINNGPNHLHGGPGGFHSVIWETDPLADNSLRLSYLSPDGEEGYPGNLKVTVTYSLTNANELIIEYKAITDTPTVINLTNHAFYNLAGEGNRPIHDHLLMINADYYTPVNQNLIPTGIVDPVAGTPFDFTTLMPIGERIEEDHPQLVFGNGYDHNYVLNKNANTSDEPQLAATVIEPVSGRRMDVYTTEPGIQFYSGNFLNGSETGKRGEAYHFRTSFCLETQHFPNSPNQPNFPSTLLLPGETYQQVTKMVFGVQKE
jgi:aldose 1-epimerase